MTDDSPSEARRWPGGPPSIRSVLIGGIIGLQIATVTAILLSTYFSSEKLLLGHARGLMEHVTAETANHAEVFLQAARGTADLTQSLASHEVLRSDDFAGMERYFFEQLRLHPSFAGIYFGALDGSFAFVKRDDTGSDGGFFSKTIRAGGEDRSVTLSWRDSSFTEQRRTRDPSDLFDPRVRPWYEKALASGSHIWTDPYIFFTSGNPGISAAHPVYGRDGSEIGVVGVDIEIVALSDFLASLVISENALAFILNDNGDVLAYPSLAEIKKPRDDGEAGLRLARIDELEAPVAQAAFAALGRDPRGFALETSELASFDLEDERYLATFSPILHPYLPWTLGIVLPENDFLGLFKDNQRYNILIAVFITLLACLLGVLLSRSIARPLARLGGYAEAIRRGDFSADPVIPSAYREARQMVTSFRQMVAGLRERDRRNEALGEVLRESEAKLRQAQKMEAVGQLTGGVAHDFNNLLGVIIGNLEVIQDDLEDKEQQRAAERAIAAALRGADLTQRLLAFARKQALAPKLVDLNALVAGMVELLHRTFGETIVIEQKLAADLPSVRIDPAQMEAALLNLATNARHAMPDGGRLTIATEVLAAPEDLADTEDLATEDLVASAEAADAASGSPETPRSGQLVSLIVSDEGQGMTPEVQARVFEPFFTTRKVGEGSGLGLSMVYGFMKQSHGRVGLTSAPGQGTSVRLTFPAAGDGEVESLPPPAQPKAPTGAGEAVLVVEDDPDMRALAVATVAGLGYEVLDAADGPAALALLDEGRAVSLLFTDVVLPRGLNGAQLAREAAKRRPGLKVLFTSGYNETIVGADGELDAGIELLAKPYRRKELARRLRELLDGPPD